MKRKDVHASVFYTNISYTCHHHHQHQHLQPKPISNIRRPNNSSSSVASNDKASSVDSRAVDDRVLSALVVVRRLPMDIPSGTADRRSSRAGAGT